MIITDKEILKQVSEPATLDEVEDIVSQIRTALPTAWTAGCGLAAIQVGIPKRVGYIRVADLELILVNPKITYRSDAMDKLEEACLSIPNKKFTIKRHFMVEVMVNSFTGETDEFTGYVAQAIQHEIDLMDGKLIGNKVKRIIKSDKTKSAKNRARKLRKGK